MRVWRPLGVNNHTNMLLWLAETGNEPSNIELWLLMGSNKSYKMSLWVAELWRRSLHFRSIAEIKGPTMRVWRPLGVNKHANMLVWLAERGNELSNVELLLLVGGNKPYKISLLLSEDVEKSSHFRSIAEIKGPTMRVWPPLGVNKHANMLLWLAESWNEPFNVELSLLVDRK